MKSLDVTATFLLVVGGLNWGLVGLLQFDLVGILFGGQGAMISRVLYAFVGVAALYQSVMWKSIQGRWTASPVQA